MMKLIKLLSLCLVVGVTAADPLWAAEEKCGIENCHGLEIQCGPNVAEMCTMMYAFGDRCRVYAQCQLVDGRCWRVESAQYQVCVECVKSCEELYKNDMPQAFACESSCG
ncbi:MAG: hypothetical protein AB7S78_12980 [Candidatus Omnitrophota bacterium]